MKDRAPERYPFGGRSEPVDLRGRTTMSSATAPVGDLPPPEATTGPGLGADLIEEAVDVQTLFNPGARLD
jgi:hypothetical protein